MPSHRQAYEYEPVTPARRAGTSDAAPDEFAATNRATEASTTQDDDAGTNGAQHLPSARRGSHGARSSTGESGSRMLRRGHALTYAGLFLFTAVLYFRPYEFLPLPSTLAYWIALFTLAVFVPSQLGVEGNLTARPREVNLVLLLCVTALLSIPLAKGSRAEAWGTFTDIFIRAVAMFIVMVNVVRTEKRLRGVLLLSLGAGCMLAIGALNNYRLGNFTVEGYRVAGVIGGMFGNPNDMALHLVTMLPLCIALFLGARGLVRKCLYASCAVLLVAGTVVTFSRGGFLAMLAVLFTLAWTLGRKHRMAVVVWSLILAVAFVALAPGNYSNRILSIFDRGRDAFGSADARQALLIRSIEVAVKNPLFGIGMGNFQFVSFRNQVSHNAYTQVAAEMGMAALVIYTMFILSPLRHLRRIGRETFAARRDSRFYYLAVGLQASLVGYLVASFFASVAYYWNVYYLVGYAVCLRQLYEASPASREAQASGAGLKAVKGNGVRKLNVSTHALAGGDAAPHHTSI